VVLIIVNKLENMEKKRRGFQNRIS